MEHARILEDILRVCNLQYDLDAEQVLDIILARGEQTGDKCVDYVNTTQGWEAAEWKSVLKEFFVSYQKADLCKLFIKERDPQMNPEAVIDAQRQTMQYKKAPDNYYLHLANFELYKPESGTPLEDTQRVLTSLYVAISSGENYGSVGYPPKQFLTDVVGVEAEPEDYYTTIQALMEDSSSLESLACDAAKNNKELAKQMKTAYKKLLGRDMQTAVQSAKTKGAEVADSVSVKSGKALRKGKKIANKVKESTVVDPNETEAHTKQAFSFAKIGIVLLVVNGLATPAKFVVGITLVKLLMAEGLKGLLPSINTIVSCFIPAIGLGCTVAMLFAGIVPGKDPRKKLAYILMVGSVLCSAYSAYTLVKLGLAMFHAWATKTFTVENIAQATTKGAFDLVKGSAKGVWNGITGLFK